MFNYDAKTQTLEISMPDVADSQDLVMSTDVWASFQPSEMVGADLKVTGRHSLLMGYVVAARLKNVCKSISVFDTRLRGYVVVVSLNPELKVGTVI